MRIRMIEPFPIAYLDPNDFGTLRRAVLVKVTTEEGATGWTYPFIAPGLGIEAQEDGVQRLAAAA